MKTVTIYKSDSTIKESYSEVKDIMITQEFDNINIRVVQLYTEDGKLITVQLEHNEFVGVR